MYACVCDSAYTGLCSNYYKVIIGTAFGLPSMKTLIRIVVRVLCETIKRQDELEYEVQSPTFLLMVSKARQEKRKASFFRIMGGLRRKIKGMDTICIGEFLKN